VLGKTAIIDFLVTNNIRDIFYLPGIHTLSLTESLICENINVFVPRHEANMAFMADGFARASGRIGVLIVTPGPGLGNVVTGCMEAYGDDIPLLVIHIDTERKEIGKGILHELVEPHVMFRHITKGRFTVTDRQDLPGMLEVALGTALEGRRGPVFISVPYTLLEKEIPHAVIRKTGQIPAKQPIDFAPLDTMLADKRRPAIIGGKSLMFEGARPLLETICRESSIPFLTTTSGKGIMDEGSPWCFGNIMQKGIVKEILSSADITIAIGTRLRDVDAKRRGVKIHELVHCDIDDAWFDKNYSASYRVSGEIVPFLEHLRRISQGRTFEWPIDDMEQTQRNERQHLYGHILGFQLIRLLKESLPHDVTTVWDLSLISYWAEYFYPVRYQHSFIMPRGTSTIFYALPAAIGVKLAKPEAPCLAICGDGGVLPTLGELSTILKYNIPVGILVLNNNSFGILEDYMRSTYSIENAMSLKNPDFVKIASAFNIKAKRVKTLAQLKTALHTFATWDKPFLLEFSAPVFSPPWRS